LNQLFFGDNLDVLRESIKDESIDLIYLDPPFNSSANYNVLFSSPKGHQSGAQIHAFEDTWHWGEEAEKEFGEILTQANTQVADVLRSLRQFLGENDMMAYLVMMANRLLELHRVLKDTGSLYLHCDPTASHYLKILLDAVFGAENFKNEISWRRSSAHSDSKQGMRRCGRIRDVIFFYTKSDEYTWHTLYTPYSEEYLASEYRHVFNGRHYKEADLTAAKPGGDTEYTWWVKRKIGSEDRWKPDFTEEHEKPIEGWEYNPVKPYNGRYWAYSKTNVIDYWNQGKIIHRETGMPRLMLFADEMPGISLQDNWDDISPASGDEDLGYATQKPQALLERIVGASSNPGDLVLDPFCGCGTAVHAAQKLERQWIGIDLTHLAISLIEKRLRDAFKGIEFDVHGTPEDYEGAKNLAERDKYQFQWWACSLVNAQPYGGKKKGADGGVDGIIFFQDDLTTSKKIIVSVKGGENVGVTMVKDLHATIIRQKAEIGLFVTLNPPTKPMIAEAASAGFYKSPTGASFPRIQILQIENLIEGTESARYPHLDAGALTFKKAALEHGEDKQVDLFAAPAKPTKKKPKGA
jgi:adenine specific DNA methylase Mod